jgi:hypothetical protein
VSGTENAPLPLDVAVPATAVEQVGFVNNRTVALASAIPVMLGLFEPAGDAGVLARPVGAPGVMLSWMYVIELEHAETLPAASVVFAVNGVEALPVTVTPMLNVPPVAGPIASIVPLQIALA